jgi:hypothetical protein
VRFAFVDRRDSRARDIQRAANNVHPFFFFGGTPVMKLEED